MKRVIYQYNVLFNKGTEKAPEWENHLFTKTLPYSELALEIAGREAWNGVYTIEDDGVLESAAEASVEERISELEAALELLLSGVTE